MSEYGKGFLICLIKFAEHMENEYAMAINGKGQFKRMFFSSGDAAAHWANGASDHLYDIEVPERWKNTELELMVNKLQSKALDMGHGSGLMGRHQFTEKDFVELRDLTRQIALLVDKFLGIKDGDLGEY